VVRGGEKYKQEIGQVRGEQCLALTEKCSKSDINCVAGKTVQERLPKSVGETFCLGKKKRKKEGESKREGENGVGKKKKGGGLGGGGGGWGGGVFGSRGGGVFQYVKKT